MKAALALPGIPCNVVADAASDAGRGLRRRPDAALREASDAQLVQRARAGSNEAFGQLVERYRERLLRFLVVRSMSRADAEDTLQDTFVNAYRYLESYDSRWQFSTWLYRIAIRNAGRRARRGQEEAGASPEPPVDPLEACVAASERENLWLAAKRHLSTEACAAMWLRYAEDMPVKDVARVLGRPEAWAKVVLFRARRRLAGELGDNGSTGEAHG